MDKADRKSKEQGILSRLGGGMRDLQKGFNDAFDVTGEDRRNQLTNFREAYQNKSEATAASLRLGTIPGLDVLRQAKTVNQNIPAAEANIYNQVMARLPVPAYSPGNWVHRQFTGLNIGRNDLNPEFPRPVQPQDVVDLGTDQEALLRYKENRKVTKELANYNKSIRNLPAMQKAGHALGTITDEIQSNGLRSLWWLINAPQAVIDLTSEGLATVAAPDLRGTTKLNDLQKAVQEGDLKYIGPSQDEILREVEGRSFNRQDSINDEIMELRDQREYGTNSLTDDEITKEARRRIDAGDDLLRSSFESEAHLDPDNYQHKRGGVKKVRLPGEHRSVWTKRRFSPNAAGLMSMLAPSIAINGGLRLLNRPEGYAAVSPTEDDPRKTDNMLAEVAARYILGREGKLLPYDEFRNERPDVSRSDYLGYKAYRHDKNWDLNPFDDGKTNAFGGILKTNDDGIHGAEVSFLGRSMGWNEALLPTVAALGGTVVGAAVPNIRTYRLKKQAPVQYGQASNPYQGATWKQPIKKIVGNLPEATPRNDQGERVINPAFKEGGKLEKLNPFLEKTQNFFEYEKKPGHVGPASLRKGRVLGTILATSAAGLLGGTLAGQELEKRRRKQQFQEQFDDIDYEKYKATARDVMERKIAAVKADPDSAALRDENATRYSKLGYNSAITSQMEDLDKEIQGMANEQAKQKAQALYADSDQKLQEVTELEWLNKRKKQDALQTGALKNNVSIQEMIDAEKQARSTGGIQM